MRKESSASLRLRSAADRQSHSGIAFIGSPQEPFHMILRIPVHVYCAVKKCFEMWSDPVKLSFYSGSMPITDLALSKFCGTFVYTEKHSGKKKRFQAAFVYPISSDKLDYYDEDIMDGSLVKLLQSFEYGKLEYFDKSNKSLKTIIAENYPNTLVPFMSSYKDFFSTFCCSQADETK